MFLPVNGRLPGQQFDVHDGEAVLVGVLADLVRERLRGRVDRRDAAHQPGGAGPLELLDQPEVGDLDAVRDHEQVARLDVEVLEVVLLDEVVEPDGGVVEEAEQHVARDARAAGLLVLDAGISCRFLSASSITMTSSPPTSWICSMDSTNGWRTCLTRSSAFISCTARASSPSSALRLP